MPWHISHGHSGCSSSKPWAVIKNSDSSIAGCHETEDSAKAQLAALNASENQFMANEYYFPAEIQNREMPESIQTMLREMIKGDFGGATPYFFQAEISSSRIDSHFTRMLDSTLHNFAGEAETGVSFLDSHKRWSLPIGYTLTGSLKKDNGITRVVSDIYTVPDIELRGHSYGSTTDFIKAVKSSLVRDVSVGFHGGDMICDICGNSFRDWRNCRHWPGRKYTINNENGDNGDGEEVIATFGIDDGHLAEVSGVYSGSTPDAMILRAEEMAQAGLFDGEEIRRLETQYRIKLPSGQRTWPTTDAVTYPGNQIQNGEKQQMDELDQIKEKLSKAGAKQKDPVAAAQWLVDDYASLKKDNDRLGPLAEQGEQYRADIVKQALAEGVRALGDDFHSETYEKMFINAEISHIKRMKDDWARQADLVFTGKRKTVDNEQQKPPAAPVSAVPDEAYKS